MAWLRSDTAKIIGTVLAAVAGTLIAFYPPPNNIGFVCTIALSILTGLGLVSGGTSGNQPKNVVPAPPPGP